MRKDFNSKYIYRLQNVHRVYIIIKYTGYRWNKMFGSRKFAAKLRVQQRHERTRRAREDKIVQKCWPRSAAPRRSVTYSARKAL